MPTYKVTWNKLDNADSYAVFYSDEPGGSYSLVSVVPQPEDPEKDPECEITINMVPEIELIEQAQKGAVLTWKEPWNIGAPWTLKIVPMYGGAYSFIPSADRAWATDVLPIGAEWIDSTGISLSAFRRHESLSIKIEAEDGYVEPGFSGATYTPSNCYIIIWVYVDEINRPDCIWISFHSGDWEHRVYYGANLCPYGEHGAKSRRYAGEIPSKGCWAPLIINTKDIEADSVDGIKFGVYKQEGTAVIYIDSIYWTEQPVISVPQSHIGLRNINRYGITRNSKFIGFCNELTYNDMGAVDPTGIPGVIPAHTIYTDQATQSNIIKWAAPSGYGMQYTYTIVAYDDNGVPGPPAQGSVTISEDYAYAIITISSEDQDPIVQTVYGSSYIHQNVEFGRTYLYEVEIYDSNDELTAEFDIEYVTPSGNLLDYFILDVSLLA